MKGSRFSQSLARGLAILGRFTPSRPVLGIADIAAELGMSRSTTHRYVTTLLTLGYLEQTSSRKYRLGLHVTDLGMSALNSTGLREHAHPYLEELRQRTSYAASLGVLDGTEVLYVDYVRGFPRRDQYEITLNLGSRLPAYCTALGKLLIANLPRSEQSKLICTGRLVKHGPNTITTKKALRAEIKRIEVAAFAVSDQEWAPGLYEVAVLVRNENREVVAAVGLAVYGSSTSLEELGPLFFAAERISARLGYRREDETAGSRAV